MARARGSSRAAGPRCGTEVRDPDGAAAHRRAARQHRRVPVLARRRRAHPLGDRRHQRDVPRRRARAADRPHRLPGRSSPPTTYADLLADAPSRVPDDRVLHTRDRRVRANARRPSTPIDGARAGANADDLYLLIFTSGSTGFPKAVRCTQGRFARTGVHVQTVAELGAGQGGVRAAAVLPLELAVHRAGERAAGRGAVRDPGAVLGVEHDARHPSHGRHDAHLHRQGPQLHPRGAARARRRRRRRSTFAFGNEASEADIREFAARFDCAVRDSYGSTEGLDHHPSRRVDADRLRSAPPTTPSAVYDPETGAECPRAEFDAARSAAQRRRGGGRDRQHRTRRHASRGTTATRRPTSSKVRDGIYWSGDLAYRDADGWFFFAGRSNEWLRVDGENFAAAPVERIVLRAPGRAFGRGLRRARRPGRRPGDGRARGRRPRRVRPRRVRRLPAAQPDLGPKWVPSFVRRRAPSCRSWRA